MKQQNKVKLIGAALAIQLLAVSTPTMAGSGPGDTHDLERVVSEQQRQIDAQASEIAALKEQVNALLGGVKKNEEELAAKVDKEELDKMKLDKVVSSKNANVDVTLYGQVNRAALWADNGDASKVYFVDNKNSTTRLGIDGAANATDDLTVGGKLEYEVNSNYSTKVNQFEEDTDTSLDLRHADLYLKSAKLGTLSLGHGSTASDGSAEVDLSGTNVVAYSQVSDLAGGQYWYNPNVPWFSVDSDGEEVFSGSQVSKNFDNMDGLSRRDRVRYDSPSFGGFSLASSAMEDSGFDAAARYEAKFGDSKLSAAMAYAKSGDLKKWDNQYNGSISFLHASGFNVTVAGGVQEYDLAGVNDPNFVYAKLGYKAELFSPGTTAFSLDYGLWNDVAKNDDEADSLGLAFVQAVKDWGTEFYLAYRLYSLDRPKADYDDVNAVMAGARFKF